MILESPELKNDAMTPLFLAVIEATEEAILNSLFAAETMEGYQGNTANAIPLNQVTKILKAYGRLNENKDQNQR